MLLRPSFIIVEMNKTIFLELIAYADIVLKLCLYKKVSATDSSESVAETFL